MQSVRTAVVGASGYSGQELLRYLSRHPVFQLGAVTSRQNAGRPLSQYVHGLPREMGKLAFVEVQPPRQACLTGYGAGLPDFLRAHAAVAALPYLADVARLDFAIDRALQCGRATESWSISS